MNTLRKLALISLFVSFAFFTTTATFAFGYVAPAEVEAGVTACVGENLNTFRCARGIESKQLKIVGTSARRTGQNLRIQTLNKVVALVDNSPMSDESYSFSYLGFDRQLNSHIVHVQLYEGTGYIVIHHASGHQAKPSGYPLAAPDKNHFLSLSQDMFAGYNANNVEVWRVKAGKFHKVSTHDLTWGPTNATWKNAGRAVIHKLCYDITGSNPAGLKACGIAEIKRTLPTWTLIE